MARGYPVCHELKSWPIYFEPVFNWKKRCEMRQNDRGFEAGDFLLLREWEQGGPPASEILPDSRYTGRWAIVRVTYIDVPGSIPSDPPIVASGDAVVMSFVLLDQSDDAPEPEPAR